MDFSCRWIATRFDCMTNRRLYPRRVVSTTYNNVILLRRGQPITHNNKERARRVSDRSSRSCNFNICRPLITPNDGQEELSWYLFETILRAEFRYRIHLINQMQEGGCKVSKKAGDCNVRISYLILKKWLVSRSSMQLYRLRGREKILNGVWIHLSFVWHLFDFIPCGLCHVRMAMKENYYEIIWYSSICVVSIIYNHFLLQWRWSVKSTPDIRLFFSSFLFNILIFLNRNALIAYTY